LAAKQATGTLPIVFIGVGDPVTSGLVTSLARPGGSATGLSVVFPELVSKRIELLTQAVSGVKRIAVLWQPGALDERTQKDRLKRAEDAGHTLGVQLQFVEARHPKDLDRAFSEINRARAGNLFRSAVASGSWGGRCLSLGGYVPESEATRGRPAAKGRRCWVSSRNQSPVDGHQISPGLRMVQRCKVLAVPV